MKTKRKTSPPTRAKAKPRRTSSSKRSAQATAKRANGARWRGAKAVRGRPPAVRGREAARSRWVRFVEKHGVVLASARGPVPSVAEAVAGEPIVGSWWAHPKGKAIFAALSEIDDSTDVRCFKLVDGKVTFVHRRAWPALVRLGRDGVIAPEQLASVAQEHLPTGEHRNFVTPFPEWVDDATARAADGLTVDRARAQLAWVDAG